MVVVRWPWSSRNRSTPKEYCDDGDGGGPVGVTGGYEIELILDNNTGISHPGE